MSREEAARLRGNDNRVRDAIYDPSGRPNLDVNGRTLQPQGVLLQSAYHLRQLSVGLSYHHDDVEQDGEEVSTAESIDRLCCVRG
ncbi:hypothetical protein [Stutzerimonas stutzeri]|uniref:hypothetical protein n=1 Tax=Stutzerimonas stutzeri TaxID=316 RepID=UPI003722B963